MDRNTPAFQTHAPDPAESPTDVRAIWQFIVQEVNPAGSSDPSLLRCRLTRQDATDQGNRDYIVAGHPTMAHAENDVIFATRPKGGTSLNFNGRLVSWVEIPVATNRTVQITGTGSIAAPDGSGVYDGFIVLKRPHNVDETKDLNLPDSANSGETIGVIDVVFENDDENLMPGASHMLPLDGSRFAEARFTGGYTNDATPKQIWRGQAGWGFTAEILIVSASSLSGLYNGTVYTGATNLDGTANLTMPAGLTVGVSCLLVNSEEDSAIPTTSGTTRLKPSTYVTATYIGPSKETPPRPTFIVRGGVGRIDSPKNLPTGGLTPDTTTWNRDTDGKPLTVALVTGVFWDGTAKKLVQNTRVFTFDARGNPHDVSGETATTIDTASACSSS